jgi:hypothetical protein
MGYKSKTANVRLRFMFPLQKSLLQDSSPSRPGPAFRRGRTSPAASRMLAVKLEAIASRLLILNDRAVI